MPLSARNDMFSSAWYVKYDDACNSAIRWSTGSVPGFGPASSVRSQA